MSGRKTSSETAVGMEFPGQRQGFRAAHCDQHLKSLVARKIAQDACIVRIVFHDQQHGIARLQIVAIVRNLFDRMFR